jgi:pimeloyl-ACP methyl ester carboxylesterase
MKPDLSRRALLVGGGGVVGAGALAGLGLSGVAEAAPGPSGPPGHAILRPVAPVNQAVAEQMPLEYKVMPEQAVGIDAEQQMAVATMQDVLTKRAQLIQFLWKGAGLPTRLPQVQRGVALPPEISSLTGVAETRRLVIPLNYGVTATQYLVIPKAPSNHRFGIYHTGHGEDPVIRVRTVQALLDRGYQVLCSDLPFVGWNVQDIDDPADPAKKIDIGTGTTAHNHLGTWRSDTFEPLTFWLEPLAVALNYAESVLRPRSINVIGLSGGGWATTAYAAIDPRVTRSYPTAGSLPEYLHAAPPGSQGDFEQEPATSPGFYAIVSYLDLYAMGATGYPRRGQLQILNRFDACCFMGVGHRSYVAALKQRVAVIGEGTWDMQEDATHNLHQISPFALQIILWDQEANPPD